MCHTPTVVIIEYCMFSMSLIQLDYNDWTTLTPHPPPPPHTLTHTPPRRLSMEVDQLLGQIGEPNTYADYDVPRSIYGNRSQQRLKFEERALQGQLDELSNKRDKLANELHGLITQVREGRGAWEREGG